MKFKINVEFTPHGSFSWEHSGNDAQWCEAGETVRLLWSNDAKWGLQEAHYTDGEGTVTDIDITTHIVEFTMPAKDITIGGTFKRFVLPHWTEGKKGIIDPEEHQLFAKGPNGEPVAITLEDLVSFLVDSTLNAESPNPVANAAIVAALALKQDLLVSGENIKTVNGLDLTGEGNVAIGGTDLALSSLGYPTFSAEQAYEEGEVVVYNDHLWQFTEDHAAGEWTGTDAEQTDLVTIVNAGLTALNAKIVLEVSTINAELAKKANIDGSYETLYAGSAGSIRGTKTNTDTYLERPTGGEGNEVANGLASIVALKGNSIAGNQLISHNTHSDTKTDITFTNNGDGSWTVDGTAVANRLLNLSNDTFSHISGHKYLVSISPTSLGVDFVANGAVGFGSTTSKSIIVCSNTTSAQTMALRVLSGVTVSNVIVWPQIIDLTLMGYPNIDTTTPTVTEVEAWLAKNIGLKPYYAYNAGSIVNAVMTGVKTTGRNLLDPVTKKARCLYYTWEGHNGMFTVKNLPSGATLTFTPDATGVAEAVTPDADGHFSITSDGWLEASAATAETYVCMTWDETKDDESVAYDANQYPFDVRKVYGQLDGEGSLAQVFETGMKVDDVLGSTRDAIYVENGIIKAVVKVGTVSSLKSLSWTKQSNVNAFFAEVPGMNTTDEVLQRMKGLICSRYTIERVSPTYNDMGDKRMIRRSGNVCIKDNDYSDATTFKNSLENVPLNYELATPLIYTNLVYRDNGVDTPLGEVLLNMVVDNWGIEQVEVTPYSDGIPTSCAPTIETLYGIDVVEQLDTIDKEGIDVDALRANLNALVSCINTNCGEVLGGTISVSETATDKVFAFTFTPNPEPEPTNNEEEEQQ